MKELTKELFSELAAPFGEDEIQFLPRATGGGRALALAYIDARSVMNRLDTVVGPENWSFDFVMLTLDGKRVKGQLTVCGVTKSDAGEASGEDEPLKAAVSDAIKRAAVHFKIGRYLYYLPDLWSPYDPQKKRWLDPQPRHAPAHIAHALRVVGYAGAGPAASQPARDSRQQANSAPQQQRPPVTNGGGAQEPAKAPAQDPNWLKARDEFLKAYKASGRPQDVPSLMLWASEAMGEAMPRRSLADCEVEEIQLLTDALVAGDPFGATSEAAGVPAKEVPGAFKT